MVYINLEYYTAQKITETKPILTHLGYNFIRLNSHSLFNGNDYLLGEEWKRIVKDYQFHMIIWSERNKYGQGIVHRLKIFIHGEFLKSKMNSTRHIFDSDPARISHEIHRINHAFKQAKIARISFKDHQAVHGVIALSSPKMAAKFLTWCSTQWEQLEPGKYWKPSQGKKSIYWIYSQYRFIHLVVLSGTLRVKKGKPIHALEKVTAKKEFNRILTRVKQEFHNAEVCRILL